MWIFVSVSLSQLFLCVCIYMCLCVFELFPLLLRLSFFLNSIKVTVILFHEYSLVFLLLSLKTDKQNNFCYSQK